jgi:hypothetical protein
MVYDTQFLTMEIQRGKSKPAKFRHYLKMPVVLYQELCDNGIIRTENYFVDELAFFEFKEDEAIINFISLYLVEDLHRKIDYYLIVRANGNYPIKRGISC